MAIRMFGLLAVALVVHFKAPQLVDAGFIFFLFAFYSVDLVIETTMLVGSISTVKKVAG